MCYNLSYQEQKVHQWLATEGSRYAELDGYEAFKATPNYYFLSGFVHPLLPIVKHERIEMHSWGLVPEKTKDEAEAKKLRKMLLNAKAETIFNLPSFRVPIRTKRAALPVTGFFEWRDVNKKKYPYLIREKDSDVTCLGCIYDLWENKADGTVWKTYSIITTAANPLMEKIHNEKKRMPLILSGDDAMEWTEPSLTEGDIKQLMQPYDERYMEAYTVPNFVNSAKNHRNIAEATEVFDYAELPPL